MKNTQSSQSVAVIIGSAWNDGNTAKSVDVLCEKLPDTPLRIDLSQLQIMPFEYGAHHDRDDFRSVIAMMLQSEHIVFATPVYWYAMSGVMKGFFDRLTDLLLDQNDRTTGHALAGQNVWLLANGSGTDFPAGFTVPFEQTASYLAMNWRDALYVQAEGSGALSTKAVSAICRLARVIGGIA
ncbi:MAG: NAD(P)H-dependent oxidoreductase [Pseudomonadota bacterium]